MLIINNDTPYLAPRPDGRQLGAFRDGTREPAALFRQDVPHWIESPIRGTFPRVKTKTKPKSALDEAASRLRSIALTAKEGGLVGSEETLIAKLGVSRATVRQAARLLEREGFLRVRRGINGGYFAARPDVRTIEKAVSSYLEMVHTNQHRVRPSAFRPAFRQGRHQGSSRIRRSLAQCQAARIPEHPERRPGIGHVGCPAQPQ